VLGRVTKLLELQLALERKPELVVAELHCTLTAEAGTVVQPVKLEEFA
jgi:hypothetical protein